MYKYEYGIPKFVVIALLMVINLSGNAFFMVTMHFTLKSADQKCHIPISDPKNMYFTYEFSSERPNFPIIFFLMDIFLCKFWFLIQ